MNEEFQQQAEWSNTKQRIYKRIDFKRPVYMQWCSLASAVLLILFNIYVNPKPPEATEEGIRSTVLPACT